MEKNRIRTTYSIHAGNYDWGCSIDYAILSLEEAVDAVDGSKFQILERKQVTDTSNVENYLYIDELPRKVKNAYLCDEEGKPVEGPSRHIKVELEVWPGEGNPFAFTSRLQIFLWVDPYQLLIEYDGEYELDVDPEFTKRTTAADAFAKKEWITSDGTRYPYAEYTPDKETDTLFVWLHGLGEGQIEGSDPYLPLLGHKGTVLASEKFQDILGGAHILVPQCPTYWMDDDGKCSNVLVSEEENSMRLNQGGTSYYTDSLDEMIDDYAKQIGAKQIALGGCSNGGFMVLMLAMKNPGKYKAIVPVCEAVPDRTISQETIEKLAKEPLYFIFAKDDPIVIPELHELPTIARLKAAEPDNLHVFNPDHVVDKSGLYFDENGNPYQYMGHLSWIYFDNNETDDGEGLSVWEWIGEQLNKPEK